jgi:hypothetical protein
MKFTFRTPDSSHGIRVIDEIPDLRLCRVEGLNGIGKTLAIHLLEICTGQQPYAGPTVVGLSVILGSKRSLCSC